MSRFEQVDHCALSDVGVRRSHNQDACSVILAQDGKSWREKGHVFAVADGMGAHAVGELASSMAVNIIPHTYQKYAHEGIVHALQKAFTEANYSIYDRGRQNPEFEGMGTTSTTLIIREDGAWIGHVGDSRAYRIRDGKIQQLSFDHSLIWEKARRQKVSPEQLQNVPTNVIVRSMGPDAEVEVDIHGPHPIQKGDVFLLCSDGLSGQLTDAEIGAIATALPADEACQLLVDIANLRGGPDNITVIIVKGAKGKFEDRGPRKRKSLLQRIPWPLQVLFLGIVLAGISAYLVAQKQPVGKFTFIAAGLAIIAGIAGLVIYHIQEKNRQENEPDYQPRTTVHREAECEVDDKLLSGIKKVEEVLVTRAQQKKWDADWANHERHHAKAEKAKEEGNLPIAFRETCRAVRPFTEALSRIRHKEEAFKPVWEKK